MENSNVYTVCAGQVINGTVLLNGQSFDIGKLKSMSYKEAGDVFGWGH